MKKVSKIIFGAFMLVAIVSCNINVQFGKKGSGTILEQERKFPEFTCIDAGGGIDVFMTQGDVQKILVITDDNLQEFVKTEVNGDVLKIYTERSLNPSKKLMVKVMMKEVKSISFSGGSDFFTENPINVGELKMNFSGGSDGKITLKAVSIDAILSGGSDIDLNGTVGELKVDASGGGDFKAYGLSAANADVSASGGSDIFITVENQLKASASGGSDIKYKGNAKLIKSETSGGSDIIKE